METLQHRFYLFWQFVVINVVVAFYYRGIAVIIWRIVFIDRFGYTLILFLAVTLRDWERFGRHEETGDMISEMLHEEAFIRGFRFAAQIMVAVYGNNDSLPELLKLFGLDSPGGK